MKFGVPLNRTRTVASAAALLCLAALAACNSDDDVAQSGSFGDTPVAGLDYEGQNVPAKRTGAAGVVGQQSVQAVRGDAGGLTLSRGRGFSLRTSCALGWSRRSGG